MLTLNLKKEDAEQIFEILHSVLEIARSQKDDRVIAFTAPVMIAFGLSFLDAQNEKNTLRKNTNPSSYN